MNANDPIALQQLGILYNQGHDINGVQTLQKNIRLAVNLWERAGELGCAKAYFNLASVYYVDKGGIKRDKDKAVLYWKKHLCWEMRQQGPC